MNLIGSWLGSMPVCHGSGGLAGQYRFGARSSLSIVKLGFSKLLLGILFGSSLLGLLEVFFMLAVMMCISGVELACASKTVNENVQDEFRRRENFATMMMTAGTLVAYSNDGICFIAGLITAVILAMTRLGLRPWWDSFYGALKSIPREWKHQNQIRPVLPVSEPSEDGYHSGYHDEQTPIDHLCDKPKSTRTNRPELNALVKKTLSISSK